MTRKTLKMITYDPERGLFVFNIKSSKDAPKEYRNIPPRIRMQAKTKILILN
jgi:hypothetical protein